MAVFKYAVLTTFNLFLLTMVYSQSIPSGIFYTKFSWIEKEESVDDNDLIMINFKENGAFTFLNQSKQRAELGRGTFEVSDSILTLAYENIPDNNLFNRHEIKSDTELLTVSITIIDKITMEPVNDAVIHIHNNAEMKYYADSLGVVQIPKHRLIGNDLLILKRKGFRFQEIVYDGFQSISCYSTQDSYYQSIDAAHYSVINVSPAKIKLGFEMVMGLIDNNPTSVAFEFLKIGEDQTHEILKNRKDHILFILE